MFKIVDIELVRINQKTCDPANKNFSKIEHRNFREKLSTKPEEVSNTNSLLISNPR